MTGQSELPWSPRTRQKMGEKTEQQIVKKRGGRVHPRSGAGSIKDDGSSDFEVMEIKDANKSYTLNGKELEGLYRRATRQNKDASFIIYFTGADLTATINITKGKG